MNITFSAKGHRNILAKHKATLEFTKDPDVTLMGDCIIGVSSDFSYDDIKKILNAKKIAIMISAGDMKERVTAIPNPSFSSNEEIVIRRSNFTSERTLAINADKACIDLNRNLINKLKDPGTVIKIEIEEIE